MKPLAVHTNNTDKGRIGVFCVCPMCRESNVVENVSIDGISRWQLGEPIQGALPELSATEREMLMTGYCQTCWDKMFPQEDDDFTEA